MTYSSLQGSFKVCLMQSSSNIKWTFFSELPYHYWHPSRLNQPPGFCSVIKMIMKPTLLSSEDRNKITSNEAHHKATQSHKSCNYLKSTYFIGFKLCCGQWCYPILQWLAKYRPKDITLSQIWLTGFTWGFWNISDVILGTFLHYNHGLTVVIRYCVAW